MSLPPPAEESNQDDVRCWCHSADQSTIQIINFFHYGSCRNKKKTNYNVLVETKKNQSISWHLDILWFLIALHSAALSPLETMSVDFLSVSMRTWLLPVLSNIHNTIHPQLWSNTIYNSYHQLLSIWHLHISQISINHQIWYTQHTASCSHYHNSTQLLAYSHLHT